MENFIKEVEVNGISHSITLGDNMVGSGLKKDENGVVSLDSLDINEEKLVKITYSELKSLRDNSQLTPGSFYRITDYVTTTTQSETKSANHPFDVIVLALSENTLCEDAKAILHEGDTYFADSDLSAWELKYCLDNDKTRFAWADETNGKGVIYRMIDEKRNDCPYDFKNILFYNTKLTTDTTSDKYYYTFSYVISGVLYDGTTEKQAKYCYKNTMDEYHELSALQLNSNVFRNTSWSGCNSNKFGRDCNSNTFGSGCSGNIFGPSCYSNTFGSNCSDNIFGDGCYSNEFGDNYNSNTFGSGCSGNIFGSGCNSNTFGSGCNSNTFGNNCYSNEFGSGFRSNTFGDNCSSNTFGNGCESNKFGSSCSNNNFGDNCKSNNFDYNCKSNTLGPGCEYNNFESNCSLNNFGNNCNSNDFERECKNNIFGSGCKSNTFGDYCNSNKFGKECSNNIFGNVCNSNVFGRSCYANTFIDHCYNNTFGDVCYKNKFGNGCISNTFGYGCISNTFGDYCVSNNFGYEIQNRSLDSDKISITPNEEFYDDGSGQLVPTKHPDLSTQPSILPYKFMGEYIYEQLVPVNKGDRVINNEFAVETPMIMSAEMFSVNSFKNINILATKSNALLLDTSSELNGYISIKYTDSSVLSPSASGGYYYNSTSTQPSNNFSIDFGVTENGARYIYDNDILTLSKNGKIDENSIPTQYKNSSKIIIDNNVTSIGNDAFRDCSNLTSVTIPNSVTSIERSAFNGCTSLTSVTIPNNVKSIGDNAFNGCTSLTSVHIDDIVAWCNIEFGFNGANPLVRAKNLYLNSEKVTELVIPNSVKSIRNAAFNGCTSLTSVTIPNSVKSIGDYAFNSCTSLTSVTIPNSVTSIGEQAFENCSSLTSLTIPESVTSIGYGAFQYCKGLTEITCKAINPPSVGTYGMHTISKSIPVYVPAESVEAYKSATYWNEFTNIQAINE